MFTIYGLIISEITYVFFELKFSIGITAIFGATVLYAASNDRMEILHYVDYSVLVFFAAMFVFTSSLLTSGLMPMIMTFIPQPTGGNSIVNIIQVY